MEFEFDSDKSRLNKRKHGIDFIEAKQLWNDPDRIEIPARSEDERGMTLIAQHKGQVWTAFWTVRRERIRLISVRRSRGAEKRLYYEG